MFISLRRVEGGGGGGVIPSECSSFRGGILSEGLSSLKDAEALRLGRETEWKWKWILSVQRRFLYERYFYEFSKLLGLMRKGGRETMKEI